MVATQLLSRAAVERVPMHLVAIDRQASFAEGPAYRTADTRHLLNVPAGNMSAFAERPADFFDWARARDPRLPLEATATPQAPATRLHAGSVCLARYSVKAGFSVDRAWRPHPPIGRKRNPPTRIGCGLVDTAVRCCLLCFGFALGPDSRG
jgi:hypothetical protein